jgi:hypothetical protein
LEGKKKKDNAKEERNKTDSQQKILKRKKDEQNIDRNEGVSRPA